MRYHSNPTLPNHTPLGYHPTTKHTLHLADEDRYSGMSILGLPGMGKSGAIENYFIHSVMQGGCHIFIDPHRDSTMKIIRRLPQHMLHKVFMLLIDDLDYPFNLNMLADVDPTSELEVTKAINSAIHVFETQWPEIMSQAHFPRYLRMVLYVLLCNRNCTLIDMYGFLLDTPTRKASLKAITDPSVVTFWQRYDEMTKFQRDQQIEPLLTRLESLFSGRAMVRNILGHAQNSIDFRQFIQEGNILFVPLPLKAMKEESKLIGSILIAMLHRALFSFGNIPEDQRPGFSLFIDEWQNFSSEDIAELITEGRKFRVKLCVANQFLAQLPPYLQEAINATRTKICFQLTPDDARERAHLFPSTKKTVKPEDIETRAMEWLLTHDMSNPVIRTLVDTYFYPLQKQKKNGAIEIKKPGFRPVSIPYALLGGKAEELPAVKVLDPTQHVNRLLYEVMSTGNADVAIPSQIVAGFANCGRGFYGEFSNTFKRGELLSPQVRYPAHLVVPSPDGTPRWTRKPETGMEQLYHFLFHLRMLVQYLAKKPIGKETTQSVHEVAQSLSMLPKRAAWVRSGNDMGVMFTEDASPMCGEQELQRRIQLIVTQTRAKYCRPPQPPQAAGVPPSTAPSQPKPRWEDVQ